MMTDLERRLNLPTLSVLLPNYNHAQFVGGALRAILAQSEQATEIIVVDDGSTDNSVEVIASIARSHPSVRLVCNENNRGVCYSLSRALAEATGEYVYAAAADDQVLPGFFERSLKLLSQHPEAALCCTEPSHIDAITGIVSANTTGWSARECYFSPPQLAAVMNGRAIAGHTSIMRRDALLEAGGWIEGLQWYTDWFAVHVMAFRRGICFIPATLALFRASLNSYCAAGLRSWKQQRNALQVLLGELSRPELVNLLPLIESSGVLKSVGHDLTRVMVLHPELLQGSLAHLLVRSTLQNPRRLIRDPEVAVRTGAAQTLGVLPRGAFWALPALVSALRDHDGRVRLAARKSIARILGPWAPSLTGRTLVRIVETWNATVGLLKKIVRPVVATIFRTLHWKLYARTDRTEAALMHYGVRLADAQWRAQVELRSLRRALENQARSAGNVGVAPVNAPPAIVLKAG
jgi:Glycosyl transferase family 2